MVRSPGPPIDGCGAFANAFQQSEVLQFPKITPRLADAHADGLGIVIRLKVMVGR